MILNNTSLSHNYVLHGKPPPGGAVVKPDTFPSARIESVPRVVRLPHATRTEKHLAHLGPSALEGPSSKPPAMSLHLQLVLQRSSVP
eukprot:778142-Amphidinium_carterae.1